MPRTTERITPPVAADGSDITATHDRRSFLRMAGLGGLAVALPTVLAACAKDTLAPTALTRAQQLRGESGTITLDFSTDTGVLNYAYALEQLEAAFYIQVLATPYAGMPANELLLLTDVRDHEIAHREFFKAALGSTAIPGLTVDFSSIDFTSRSSVLTQAQVFEDTGVSAYNGAAHYIQRDGYLVVAGKIVSVEARHAAAIRDLLQPRSSYFAPVAFDKPATPDTVLAAIDPFVVDTIVAINT